MEQIKCIFNNDERGIQYFIINTNNLTDFSLSYLDKPYPNVFNDLRKYLKSDPEYLDFERTFLFKIYVLKNRKNIILDNYEQDISRKMSINENDHFNDQILTFINNSLLKKAYKIKDLIDLLPPPNLVFNFNNTQDIPNWVNYLKFRNISNKKNFDSVNTWVTQKLKEAWEDFRKKQVSLTSHAGNSKNIYQNVLEKNKLETPKTYPKFGKESYVQNGKGKLELYIKDSVNCLDLGIKDNCKLSNFSCLISDDVESLTECFTFLSRMNDDLYDDESISKSNPEIVLLLLNRFGFKVIKSEDKYILMGIEKWYKDILPTIYPNFREKFLEAEQKNICNYLNKLINFINNTDLNYLLKDIHRKALNKTDEKDINMDMIKENSTQIPINQLTNFYENRRLNNMMRPQNTSDFIKELYYLYDLKLPSYLQNGGNIKQDEIRKQFDEGLQGHKYLKYIFDLLIKSLKNVTLDKQDLDEINMLLQDLENIQEELLSYLIFLSKVKEINDMFLEQPIKNTLNREEFLKLNEKLAYLVKEFQEREDKIAEIIESIARKDVNPYQTTNAFD